MTIDRYVADIAQNLGGPVPARTEIKQFRSLVYELRVVFIRQECRVLQQVFDKTQTEACCVTRTTAPMINPVVGVVTQRDIEKYRNTT